MMTGQLTPPASLDDGHDLTHFDCGLPILNDWLRKRALNNNRSGASRTYVICEGQRVVGYYCLATGGIEHDAAPNSLRRNMPDPIPVLVLGRLAIDHRYQIQGLGRALLRDAVLRCLHVAEIAGVTALLVHAISDQARRFYQSCGFIQFPIQPLTLCLILKTARQAGLQATPNPLQPSLPKRN
jgi:GNAT superfamily N-acetyltransferase